MRANQALTMRLLCIEILIQMSYLLPQLIAAPVNMTTAPTTTLPSCQRSCGNLTIPYPFGIGKNCSISPWHNIICDASTDPPKTFLATRGIELLYISETHLKIRNSVTYMCFNSQGNLTRAADGTISLTGSPFTISGKANLYTALGCDDIAVMGGEGVDSLQAIGGCFSYCYREKDLDDGSCSGLGCCQTAVPTGLQSFFTLLRSIKNHTSVMPFDPCTYAFLAEEGSYVFQVKDLSDPSFLNRTMQNIPVVLDWSVGSGTNCTQAIKSNTYACKDHTTCSDSESELGYSCFCNTGFEGNPYLGCTDINECAGPDNLCSHICTNTHGNYTCSCPKGLHGDGYKKGTSCTKKNSQLATQIGLGVSIGLLVLLLCVSRMYFIVRKRKLMRMREEFFKQNGGLLLKQQTFSNQSSRDSTRVFSDNELKSATKNYSDVRIIGTGGNGTVYKGILPDDQVVAIKKSKMADQTQIEQFINEVIILTQINHRHVVKLLGCCLETEVPLLVYEYVSNGSLYDHIHSKTQSSWLTWSKCMRIASEAAHALDHLHSAVNVPIIHRDIKSANILVDESYQAKIADFGASRLVPLDQTQVNTLVQGTLGYLDPEYFHSSQLTEKSDVYSFGVVLAELLTREKPLSMERGVKDRNLATYFSVAVKENRVLEIIYPQLKEEATEDQLVQMARLVKRCLNVKGEDRPSMREVAAEIDVLRSHMKHPWAERDDLETTTSLIDHTQGDLYPVPMSSQSGETADFTGSDCRPSSSILCFLSLYGFDEIVNHHLAFRGKDVFRMKLHSLRMFIKCSMTARSTLVSIPSLLPSLHWRRLLSATGHLFNITD